MVLLQFNKQTKLEKIRKQMQSDKIIEKKKKKKKMHLLSYESPLCFQQHLRGASWKVLFNFIQQQRPSIYTLSKNQYVHTTH
jgi:hypothetical protein